MDSFRSLSSFSSSPDYSSLKEPRGFIRILQLIFAICAFATTCGYTGTISISGTCNNKTMSSNVTFSYPFVLSDMGKLKPLCLPNEPIYGDFSSGSQFYVFVGVITFLFCIGVLLLYTLFASHYESKDIYKKCDFIVSAILVVLWFIASCAWASGTDQLKRYTDGSVLRDEICVNTDKCDISGPHAFAGLNISLVFGFANVAIWMASLWFLWKETAWFNGPEDQMMSPLPPSVDGAPL